MILRKECSQIIEQILDPYGDFLGKDREGYTNHCIRVAHLCLSIASEKPSSLEKICISAAFHDLGIWTAQTFDYLEPSVNLAKRYLVSMGKQEWESEITYMISNHHKVSPCKEENMGLTEAFRQADFIDVSLGLITFGVSRSYIKDLQRSFPNAGFQRRLLKLSLKWFCTNPLNPFPMFRW